MKYNLYKVVGNDLLELTDLIGDVSKRSTANEISEELTFSMAYTPNISNINTLNEGDKVIFKVDGINRFYGIVIKKSVSKTNIGYTCNDFGWYMNKNEEIYQFNDTVANNVKKICKDFGIEIGYLTNIPTRFNKIVKGNLSSIIKEMTDLATKDQGIKYYWYVSNAKFYLERFNASRIIFTNPILKGNNITDFISDNYSSSASIDGMYNAVKAVDSEENRVTQLAYQQDLNSINKYGKIQKLESISKDDKPKALNIARNVLSENNKIQRSFSITTLGNVECRANKVLSFSEPLYGLVGNYKIKQCTHNFSNKSYTMDISLEVI